MLTPATHSETALTLADFIGQLTTTGDVQVPLFTAGDPTPDGEVRAVLQAWEQAVRAELAGEAPPAAPDCALWAARQFFLACQFLVCRDVPAETVTARLAAPCPFPRSPPTDFAVDLVFRFLPDLHEFARQASPDDALVRSLALWAREWPLSSVGVPVVPPPDTGSFAGSAALLRLYADRIAFHAAADRVADPRVAGRLRADLGAHPDLSPELARALTAGSFAAALPAPISP